MNNSANNLFTAVDMILDHKLQNAKFDTSAIAVVLKKLESEANSNKYEIRYEDSVLEAYAAEGVKYNKGDAVFVLFAQNRLEANNWILGAAHSARLALEKSELIDVNYLDVGETIVTDQPTKEEELIKINQDSRIILWDANAPSNKITIDAMAFRSYASQGNFVKVAAEFQTEDLEGNGNYGLEVIITEDGVERKLVLDTTLMIGNFYNFSYPSKQVDVFALGSKDIRIKQVALFTKGFTNGSITVSNIDIKVAQESANSTKNQIEMELLAPSGNTFIEGSESIENGLQLRAWLVKNEKPIINNLECYWFKQNPSIQTGNEKFHAYGGPGWELLNDSNNGVLDTNNLVYQVGIEEVDSKSALFKAVIIFEGNKFQSVITIYNGTEESLSINIINAQNQLECHVQPSSEEYLYQWYRVDTSGHWAPIKGATGAILAISSTAAGSFGCAVNKGEKYIGFASTEIYGEIDDIKDFKIEYAYGDSNIEPPSGAQEIAIGDNLRGKTVIISAEYLDAYQEDNKTFFKAADYIIERNVYWQAYSANGDWGDNGGDQFTLNVGGNYGIPNTLHVSDSGSIAPTEFTFPNDKDYIVTTYSPPLLAIKYSGDGEWSLTQPAYQSDKYLWQRVTKTYLDGKVKVTHACIDSPSTEAYVINMSNDTVVISGEPTADALKTLTENIVTVWYGSKDITNECEFQWNEVSSDDAVSVANENISYLTSLNSDNVSLIVSVSLNGELIGSMAQTISRVHDGQPGSSAVNYKLIVSPNMINWSKTEGAVTVTLQDLKIPDKSEDITSALGASGLSIKFNGNPISGVEKEIPHDTEPAYFELVSTDGLVRDREDISIVQDGQDGKDGAPGADGKDGEAGPQGPQGIPGENGKDGVSFVGILEYYYATNSIDDIPNESTTWSTTPNEAGYSENKKYLWNYEVVKLSDGNSDPTDPALISVWGTDGEPGKDGSYPTDFISYYAIHNDGTTPPSPQPTENDVANNEQTVGSWSRTPAAAAQGEYLWEKMFTVIYNPTEKKNTYVTGTPTVIGYSGTNGEPGNDGKPGDSTTTITLYHLDASTTVDLSAPNGPSNDWVENKPATTNEKQFLFSCTGLKTVVYNGKGEITEIKYYFAKENINLIGIYGKEDNPAFVAQYNQYLKLTQNGEKDIMQWKDDELYIKASVLAVGSGNDYSKYQFYASNLDYKVYIAGWQVGTDSISTGTLGSSGSMYLSPTGVTTSSSIGELSNGNWCIAINNTFGVTKDGKVYSTAGEIGGWTIGTKMLYDGTIAGMVRDGVGSLSASQASSAGSGVVNGTSSSSAYTPQNGYLRFYAGGQQSSMQGSGKKSYVYNKIANFYVTSKGYLYANDAYIGGTINATGGIIGNLRIQSYEDRLVLQYLKDSSAARKQGNFILAPQSILEDDFVPNGSTIPMLMVLGEKFMLTDNGDMEVGTVKISAGNSYPNFLVDKESTFGSSSSAKYLGIGISLKSATPSNSPGIATLFGTWKTLSSITVLSDKNQKNSIEVLSSQYSQLFDNLIPVRYKYNDGASNRYHTGFIAQDVEEAITQARLTTQDFAGYVYQEGIDTFASLRYEEFIALNTMEIQKLKKEVAQLKKQLAALT